MEREIKFRALNNNAFYYGFLLIDNSTPDCVWIMNNNGVSIACDKGTESQYTGLKDRNGVEVYEGDILKTWYSRDTSGKDIIEYDYVVEFEINEHTGKSGFQIDFLNNCEIIGNIYQHPHLLKQK